jgi:putative DNA primase/helicase
MAAIPKFIFQDPSPITTTAQFADSIRKAGYTPPKQMEPNKFYRFPGEGKRNSNKAGWCKLFADGQGGVFGDYSTGVTTDWQARRDNPFTPAECAGFKRQVAEAKIQADEDRVTTQITAAARATKIWDRTQEAPPDHAYLSAKKVKASGARLFGNVLVIAVQDASGPQSLQFIQANGTKTFMPRGRISGCYFPIGDMNGVERFCICEGFATGASIHEATGLPVVVAFNAGNLLPVTKIMRERFPGASLIVCADDDWKTEGNPGRTKATEAAQAVGGLMAVPVFGPDRLEDMTDFNDMASQRGLDAVKSLIQRAADKDSQTLYSEPLPLPKLPPVPDFPLDLLPDALRPWIADAAGRARFSPAFAGVGCMAALGSVIGRKIGIRLKKYDDWTEYANVWGGIIGPPSALKSPAIRAAMKPFKALQMAADEVHAKLMAEYRKEVELFKLRKDAKKKAQAKALQKDPDREIDLDESVEPEAPLARTYWTSDVTAERLGELLAENPSGLLVERDELSSLLVTLEDERNATARGLYLSGWSGQEGYRFDRIMRGTTTLPKFALSVVGGIQPGPLARYVRGAFSGERADGLLQRFQLLVWPEHEPFDYVDRWPDRDATQQAREVFERADTLDAAAIGATDTFGGDPPFVRLSEKAQIIFVDWYTRFMQSARSEDTGGEGSAALAAHFGKYPGLVGKLALILHVADEPDAKEVSERTLLKALAWIDYLTPHARRVYHAVEHPETGAAELILARLRRGDLPPKFKAWEISRKGWYGLTDREAVKKACRLLFEHDWLIELDVGGGQGVGRPPDPVYAVSPAATVAP